MKMKTAERKDKIIWAVDIFDSSAQPRPAALRELQNLAEGHSLSIIPVYVASSPKEGLDYIAPVDELQVKLDKIVKEANELADLPGRIIIDESGTRNGAVKKLLKFAEEEGAVAIAISTHGRNGLSRLVMGSFAENILRESEWPVYFFSDAPRSKMPRTGEKERVLFATDFSEGSHRAFRVFLDGAKASEYVVIFHVIAFVLPNAMMGTTYIPENYFSEQEAWARRMAAGWLAEARVAGFNAEVIVRDGGMGLFKGDAILEAAKDCALVVMASTSRFLDRVLIGSAAYEVFRARKTPVLIYGPNSLMEYSPERKNGNVAEGVVSQEQ